MSVLRREVKMKNTVIDNLKRENQRLRSKSYKAHFIRQAFLRQFTPARTNIFLRKSKQVQKWSQLEIVEGLILRSFSRRAFQFVRKKKLLPLPGVSTLRSWIKNFSCLPGVQSNLLQILHSKITGSSTENFGDAILSFDEMAIKSKYEYHQAQDKVYGPAKKVQLVVLRGLFSKWKLPIFFSFDTTMDRYLLCEIIRAAENYSARIRGIACDLGNHKLISELQVSETKSWFDHPCDSKRKVFFFPDAPHLLKLLRNHLLDAGLQWSDGIQISRKDLEPLLCKDSKELKLHPKLTPEHLHCQQNARQRVRLAAQLLSHTTATALRMLFPEKVQQAKFVELVDSW